MDPCKTMKSKCIAMSMLVVTLSLWFVTLALFLPGKSDPELAPMCKVTSWGWSNDEALLQFPHKELTPCTKNRTLLTIVGDIATISCYPGERASYILSPKQIDDMKISTDRLSWWQSYDTPVNIRSTNFIYALCDDLLGHQYFDAHVQAPASESELRIQKGMLQDVEATYNGGKPIPPSKVFVVSLDSVGRNSFLRNFKQTKIFLSIPKPGVWTIDFKQLNVAGFQSKENVTPLLTGVNVRKLRQLRKQNIDWEERSLWQLFKSFGFRTVLGLENYYCTLCEFFDYQIHPSKLFFNFFKLASLVEGFNSYEPAPRCIAGVNSHNYMLQYMLAEASSYYEVPVFQYAHIHPGHDATQQVARLADPDIKDFLIEIERRFHDEPYLVILMADHGHAYRVGTFYANDEKGALEYKIPTLFFRFNAHFRDVVGEEAIKVLQQNAESLVSPKDLYATLVHLAVANSHPRGSQDMISVVEALTEQNTENPNVRSLFLQKIPASRTCRDIDIHAIWCGCLSFLDTPLQQHAIDYLVEAMNLKLRNTPYCKPITVHRILYFKSMSERNITHYSIEFIPEADHTVTLYGVVSVSATPEISSIVEDLGEVYRDGFYYLVQIMQRMTTYQGLCLGLIHLETLNDVPDPAFCMCEELNSPAAMVKYERVLKFRYMLQVYLAEPGQSCEEVCMQRRHICYDGLLSFLNDCDYLSTRLEKDFTKTSQCVFVKNSTAPYVRGKVLYINEDWNFSCTSRSHEEIRVCPCLPKST